MQVWRWWRRSLKIAGGLLNPWGSYHVRQTAFLKSISSFLQFLQELPVEAQCRSTMRWKNDGERRGMDTEVLAGLTNRFPPSDSLLKLNLVRPKVLQDVSCRNSKLPVENIVFIKEAQWGGKNDGKGWGMETWMLVGLMDIFPAFGSSSEINLAFL